MQHNFTRGLRTATLFLFMLLAISMTPAAKAAPQMVFDVVVDLQSTPPKALNQVTGNQMSSQDPQVVNPNDTDIYNLHPQNMAGASVELWVVVQDQSTGETKWRAQQITQTVQYGAWSQFKLRIWVQVDRQAACDTAESFDSTFSCGPAGPSTFDVVVDLQSTPPRALNQVTGNVMSTQDPQVVNPNDEDVYNLHPQNMMGAAVDLWIVVKDQSTGDVHWRAEQITQTVQYAPWATTKIRAWVQTDQNAACSTAERLDENFDCDPVEPQTRQVECRLIDGVLTAINAETGESLYDEDPRSINPDLNDSRLVGTTWVVEYYFNEHTSPAIREVTAKFIDGSQPVYGWTDTEPQNSIATVAWCALDQADAEAEAWRLKDSLGQIRHLYLPLTSAK